MTLYRTPVFRALPPTAEFWSQYVPGGEPEDHRSAGLLLHLLYGTVAGALFGPAFRFADGRTALSRDQLGVVTGFGYGLSLSGIGTRIVRPSLRDRTRRRGADGVPRRARHLH